MKPKLNKSTLQTTLFRLLSLTLFMLLILLSLSVFITTTPTIQASESSALIERTELPLPPINKPESTVSIQETDQFLEEEWLEHTIEIPKDGSLGTALNTLDISANTTYKIGQLENSSLLTNLQVGDTLTIWIDRHANLKKILYPKTKVLRYELNHENDNFEIKTIEEDVDLRIEIASGTIDSSFYMAGERAGLSAKTIMNLADLYAWEIDFIRELRKGDTFTVIYQAKYLNNEYIGDGDIIAAQITTNQRQAEHNAFLLQDEKGETIGYYNEQGKSLKKAFLKNPVDVVRITSKFNPGRFHPILKRWRAHRGVDYGGPTGTPIRTTGNGQIIFRGWDNSYGNFIKVQHAGKYMTLYGHMSKFGKFKKGDRVKQGDVIGYIGSTGLATGPHLHYEFRINGVHQDPLKMDFPSASPVPNKLAKNFKKQSDLMLTQLERYSSNSHINSQMSSFE